MEAIQFAKSLSELEITDIQKLEDPPSGGSVVKLGEEQVGSAISAPLKQGPWGWIPMSDLSVAQTLELLNQGQLILPGMYHRNGIEIPISTITNFASVGLAANNIANNKNSAFERQPISGVPTYPMLWASNSDRMVSFVVEPDQQGTIKPDKKEHADRIWLLRSHTHQAAEFGFGAQKLGVAFTERKSIGGRGWPNLKLPTKRHEKAYCLWGNSSLAIMQYWFHASKQQTGRGIMPVTQLKSLPALNVTKLSDNKLGLAEAVFDQIKDTVFQPAAACYRDQARKNLDRIILRDILGLNFDLLAEPLDILRKKWCSEPTVGSM